MEDVEVAEEIESSFQEDYWSDNESTISEKEAQLYSLIYHVEHSEPNQITKLTETPGSAIRETEFHVSSRSKAFRLNGMNAVTKTTPVEDSMNNSKSVRNHIRKTTAKLDIIREKSISETNEHPNSKFDLRRKKQSNLRNNENLYKGSNGAVWIMKKPRLDKQDKNSGRESLNNRHKSGVNGNEITGITTTATDKTPIEKETEISKYDITLNEKNIPKSPECVIVLDSDCESVDSIIEVKPPTPPPPVVISIDSSDEAPQVKENKTPNHNEKVDISPLHCVEIDNSGGSTVVPEKSPSIEAIAADTPSENSLIVSYNVENPKDNCSSQASSVPESINKSSTGKKRKKKSSCSKSRKLKPGSSVQYKNVPISWTSEMVRFYCHSWGGDTFDHEELQKKMSGSSSNWKILDIDLLGPKPRTGPYRRSRCGNCNQIGHVLEHCPDPLRELCCCMCGEKGHVKRTCPNKICLQCGRPANKYSIGCHKCFYDSKPCSTCGQYGHLMWLCPEAWRIYHSSTTQEIPVCTEYDLKTPNDQFCCNCARRGHTSHNCKIPSNETYENYPSDPRMQYNTAYKYKNQNHKYNGYHDNFFSINVNRKHSNNQSNYHITVVNDSDPSTKFIHKRKKFSNADRKRMKKKQKKRQKKTLNLEQN